MNHLEFGNPESSLSDGDSKIVYFDAVELMETSRVAFANDFVIRGKQLQKIRWAKICLISDFASRLVLLEDWANEQSAKVDYQS